MLCSLKGLLFNAEILTGHKMEGKAFQVDTATSHLIKDKACNERTCPSSRCSAASGSCPSSIVGSPGCQKHCRTDSALIGGDATIYFVFHEGI